MLPAVQCALHLCKSKSNTIPGTTRFEKQQHEVWQKFLPFDWGSAFLSFHQERALKARVETGPKRHPVPSIWCRFWFCTSGWILHAGRRQKCVHCSHNRLGKIFFGNAHVQECVTDPSSCTLPSFAFMNHGLSEVSCNLNAGPIDIKKNTNSMRGPNHTLPTKHNLTTNSGSKRGFAHRPNYSHFPCKIFLMIGKFLL